MTAEAYLSIYKKIWATVRHDIWKNIEDIKKKQRKEKLTTEEIGKINNDAHDKFESIRKEIYAGFMEEDDI